MSLGSTVVRNVQNIDPTYGHMQHSLPAPSPSGSHMALMEVKADVTESYW